MAAFAKSPPDSFATSPGLSMKYFKDSADIPLASDTCSRYPSHKTVIHSMTLPYASSDISSLKYGSTNALYYPTLKTFASIKNLSKNDL